MLVAHVKGNIEYGHVPLGRASRFHELSIEEDRYGRPLPGPTYWVTCCCHLNPFYGAGNPVIGPFTLAEAETVAEGLRIAFGAPVPELDGGFRRSPAWRALVERVRSKRRIAAEQLGIEGHCNGWARDALAEADAAPRPPSVGEADTARARPA